TLGQILFGAEEIARTKLFGEQRVAHLNDDLRRHGRGAEGNDLPLADLHGWMKPHSSSTALAPCSPRRGAKAQKVATIIKMITLSGAGFTPRCAPSPSLFEARGLGSPAPALALRLDVAGEFFGTAAERVDALRSPRQHDLV